jgi:hypothetical protein
MYLSAASSDATIMAAAHARLMAFAFDMAAAHAAFVMTFTIPITGIAVFAISVAVLTCFAILATVMTAIFGVGYFGIGDTGNIRLCLACIVSRKNCYTHECKHNHTNYKRYRLLSHSISFHFFFR